MTTVYLNGEYVAKDRAVISVDDRGFLHRTAAPRPIAPCDQHEWPFAD